MEKAPAELALPDPLGSFPGDPTRDVCPTQAIAWNEADQRVAVNADQCIGCGLCVARCPYGALVLVREQTATLMTDDPNFLISDQSSASFGNDRVVRRGAIARSSARALVDLPAALARLPDGRATVLIRNTLQQLGVASRLRRRGDTNMRIDSVGAFADGKIAVIEIELANAALDSPRALLEDVAVMHSRYGAPIDSIYPISVVASLPNARSDYYRVITDIESVLSVQCRTITISAMLILVWNFKHLETLAGDLFALNAKNADLGPSLAQLIPEVETAIEPHAGAFRPAK
jgi:Fe-S-cluster-containing hydrogenase component 2